MRTNNILDPRLKSAWDAVLFWSKRMSYNSYKDHPEWRTHYEEAVRRRDEIKEIIKKEKAEKLNAK
jgi:hypothetical protein